MKKILLAVGIGIALTGCEGYQKLVIEEGADEHGFTAPTQTTIEHNARVLEEIKAFDTGEDFEQANRGLIARDPDLRVKAPDDVPEEFSWNQKEYEFIQGDAPASVNPSLWRQEKLNNIHGLFKVTDGIYQLRGFDLANITIIEGDTGWILVDLLTTKETSSAALAFARKHLGDKPITGIIITHSHVDHFGGSLGAITPEEVKKNNIPVIVPEGFMEESTSENILAGPTMSRRAGYMYGRALPRTERGHVGSGLGKTAAFGSLSILAPNKIIGKTPQPMTIDGVDFVFHNAPASEAPAELVFYLPKLKAFCGAEVVSRNIHNLYTLRGAKVRDALKWVSYIDKALVEFADAEVYFGSHHWPIWGKEKIQNFLKHQSDAYKFTHDQTLHMAHSGATPTEISNLIKMPKELNEDFSVRDYYGTVSHNSRAVYDFYYGFFDMNPVNLNPLPPVEIGKQFVEYAGGADAILAKAKIQFEEGDYRHVATALNHVVFADPDNTAARSLLAKAYDQLGYQAESGPWRDVYLTGAQELRNGRPERRVIPSVTKDLFMQIPLEKYFEGLSVRLNAEEAEGEKLTLNFTFTDLNETYVVRVENSVLHHHKGEPDPNADATIKIDHETYVNMALQIIKPLEAITSGKMEVDSFLTLRKFNSMTKDPDFTFNIIEP
ncbi:MAG TPA: MBL fold metallo-hydrolase [Porticoccus sp.]|nr:MBL fold metallo-hydrolase [Porticoccus sp.]